MNKLAPKGVQWITSASDDDQHYKAALDTTTLGQWSLVRDGKEIRPTVTIEAVRPYVPARRRQVRLPDGQMGPEPIKRYEIRFKGVKKTWIAGPVSLEVLAQLFGAKRKGWIGQKVTLYTDHDVKMKGRRVGGIRIQNVAAT